MASQRRSDSNCFRGGGTDGTPHLILSGINLLVGIINISVIGYNFSYYKGTWRNNLFHSELAFLIIFSSSFILTSTHLIVDFVSQPKTKIHAVYHLVGNVICGVLSAIAALALLIQLSSFGRFFVNGYEIKLVSAILGLFQSALCILLSFLAYQSLSN